MVYLPHLDYDYQRHVPGDESVLKELETCIKRVVDAAKGKGIEVVVVSEYGLTEVRRPVMINKQLRKMGALVTRGGPFGEVLLPTDSKALAVCDHQLAHVYVQKGMDKDTVKKELEQMDGIACVVPAGDLELDHPRSGDWIALAEEDAWFCYEYWLDDALKPDFATTIDIHRKPGYDPCELFINSKLRAGMRLLQKKMGFRTRFDVVNTNPMQVRGSHGLLQDNQKGAVIIGNKPPKDMKDFSEYIKGILS